MVNYELRAAFEAYIKKLGSPDDEFAHYHLDEGNLYYIYGQAFQAGVAHGAAENKRLQEMRTESDNQNDTN